MIALGITFSGFSVSPAVSPTSSMPTKANTTIWNERINPCMPFGNRPPWLQRFVKLDTPELVEKPLKIITRPMTINAKMAMTLIKANQNSNSPKSLTVARFIISKIIRAIKPGTIAAHPGANIECRADCCQISHRNGNPAEPICPAGDKSCHIA